MNRILLLSILFVFSIHSFAQDWSTPLALTNSDSDNKNPQLIFLQNYYGGDDYYMFWERSVDTSFTEICVKRYYENDDAVVVISDSIHHYRNPMAFIVDNDDIFFGIYYESDENSNIDIYCILYTDTGFSQPFRITHSLSDDTHAGGNGSGDIAWERDNKIYTCHYYQNSTQAPFFSDIALLSDTLCHNPELTPQSYPYGHSFMCWEKEASDSSEIWMSERGYNDTIWSTPVSLYDSAHNINISFTEPGFFDNTPILFWDKQADSNYIIMGYEYYSWEYYRSEFYQNTAFYPSTAIIPLVVVDDFWMSGLLAFVKQQDSLTEIFASKDIYYFSPKLNDYSNVSNNTNQDSNPHIYWGKFHGACWQDYVLIWESYVNGHWQLMTSVRSECIGAIDENDALSVINISPNPAKNHFTVTYPGFVNQAHEIQTFNIRGSLMDQFNHSGSEKCIISTSKYPPGLYFVRITSEYGEEHTCKVIIADY